MTLAQKLKRSADHRGYYQRNRNRILAHKSETNTVNRHVRSLQRAIQAGRMELRFQPVAGRDLTRSSLK